MKDLLEECSPENARFFERAKKLAKQRGFKVGKGNTYKKGGRLYYAVRVKPNCGFVSFYPNGLEFYFHRLCREDYLDGQKAARLERWLQEKGFRPCDSHHHRPDDSFLLAELDAYTSPDRHEEIFEVYQEILKKVATYRDGTSV